MLSALLAFVVLAALIGMGVRRRLRDARRAAVEAGGGNRGPAELVAPPEIASKE